VHSPTAAFRLPVAVWRVVAADQGENKGSIMGDVGFRYTCMELGVDVAKFGARKVGEKDSGVKNVACAFLFLHEYDSAQCPAIVTIPTLLYLYIVMF